MITDVTNPGTVDPARQGFPPAAGSAAAPCTSPLAQGNGELQLPALGISRALPTAGTGLPAEVRPADASCARPAAPAVAASSPPARDVRGGDARPGGLPTNVCVR